MKLRAWQQVAIDRALEQYCAGIAHNLTVAAPAAGKTTMASVLAQRLFELDMIDYVVCLVPSRPVKVSFRHALERHTGHRMDGQLIARGTVITYQSLAHCDPSFWPLLAQYRVLMIYDEIHHCAGGQGISGNTWGDALLEEIEQCASYTLALSGTPWRSDAIPVATLPYCGVQGEVAPSFVYGLAQAIDDNVCRSPRLILVDNTGIRVTQHANNRTDRYAAIQEFVHQSVLPYQSLLNQHSLLLHMLTKANHQLHQIRKKTPDAAGLVVASSIAHAESIAQLIRQKMKQDCVLVNSKMPHATKSLEGFEKGTSPWLVSVGMVSEGTDIPRLQVCCHLTHIKTELHFRQVLGRILRFRNIGDNFCYMYLLADQQLSVFAHRLAEDLPKDNAVVKMLPFPDDVSLQAPATMDEEAPLHKPRPSSESEPAGSPEITVGESNFDEAVNGDVGGPKNTNTLSIFGRYWESLVALQTSKNIA